MCTKLFDFVFKSFSGTEIEIVERTVVVVSLPSDRNVVKEICQCSRFINVCFVITCSLDSVHC